MGDLEAAERELKELRVRRAKLMGEAARLEIPDVEAFEAADASTRRRLYDVDPERFAEFYKELTERRTQALMEGRRPDDDD